MLLAAFSRYLKGGFPISPLEGSVKLNGKINLLYVVVFRET